MSKYARMPKARPPWVGAPDIPDLPRCPVCMSEAKTYYIGYYLGIVGCDQCIKEVDSVEYEEEKRNGT